MAKRHGVFPSAANRVGRCHIPYSEEAYYSVMTEG